MATVGRRIAVTVISPSHLAQVPLNSSVVGGIPAVLPPAGMLARHVSISGRENVGAGLEQASFYNHRVMVA
jgi:hypothetical protein